MVLQTVRKDRAADTLPSSEEAARGRPLLMEPPHSRAAGLCFRPLWGSPANALLGGGAAKEIPAPAAPGGPRVDASL